MDFVNRVALDTAYSTQRHFTSAEIVVIVTNLFAKEWAIFSSNTSSDIKQYPQFADLEAQIRKLVDQSIPVKSQNASEQDTINEIEAMKTFAFKQKIAIRVFSEMSKDPNIMSALQKSAQEAFASVRKLKIYKNLEIVVFSISSLYSIYKFFGFAKKVKR